MVKLAKKKHGKHFFPGKVLDIAVLGLEIKHGSVPCVIKFKCIFLRGSHKEKFTSGVQVLQVSCNPTNAVAWKSKNTQQLKYQVDVSLQLITNTISILVFQCCVHTMAINLTS